MLLQWPTFPSPTDYRSWSASNLTFVHIFLNGQSWDLLVQTQREGEINLTFPLSVVYHITVMKTTFRYFRVLTRFELELRDSKLRVLRLHHKTPFYLGLYSLEYLKITLIIHITDSFKETLSDFQFLPRLQLELHKSESSVLTITPIDIFWAGPPYTFPH